MNKRSILLTALFTCMTLLTYAAKAEIDQLHPLFQITEKKLLAAWEKGYQDAKKKDATLRLTRAFMKTPLNSPHAVYLKQHTDNFLWPLDPHIEAYVEGYRAQTKKLTGLQVENSKLCAQKTSLTLNEISFQGKLRVLSEATLSGELMSKSAAEDFKEVKVFLKVGSKFFSPRSQPGEINLRECALDSQNSPSQNENSSSPKLFEGEFQVTFDLFNPDGSSRVSFKDKSFKVFVYKGSQCLAADFDLNKWQNNFCH